MLRHTTEGVCAEDHASKRWMADGRTTCDPRREEVHLNDEGNVQMGTSLSAMRLRRNRWRRISSAVREVSGMMCVTNHNTNLRHCICLMPSNQHAQSLG